MRMAFTRLALLLLIAMPASAQQISISRVKFASSNCQIAGRPYAPGSRDCVTPTTGPAGPTGAAGPAGETGATGATGAQGGTGPTGPAGSTGAQGAQGPQGAQGATGATGSAGSNGANGNTVWNGTGAPSTGTGVNGDFYLNTAASCLYGPKAAGAWPGSCVSLVGPQGATGSTGAQGSTGATGSAGSNGTNGNTIWNGSGAPSGGTGVNGDFYLNTVASCLYGPKAAGAWPGSCVSLVGPQGATGSTGAQGSTGATGATGPAGPATANGPASFSGSQQSQVTVATTKYYFTGSGIATPGTLSVGYEVGTAWIWRISGFVKNANGTGATSFYVYAGTNGSTSDSVEITQAWGTAGTAVADIAELDVVCAITSISSGTATVKCGISPEHHLATTGWVTTAVGGYNGTFTFNTASSNLIFGLGFSIASGGTMPTVTVAGVDAEAFNLY